MNKDSIPKNHRIVQNKWVFKIKHCGKFHARLCALGCTQVRGKDFTDNFAPVIKEETFQIVLTLAELKKWKEYVVDVEMAFLYRNLEETIFMTEPVGYQVIIDALKKMGSLKKILMKKFWIQIY